MKDIITPENLSTVAQTLTNNGANNTILATFIIIVLAIITVLIGFLFFMMKSNQKTIDKLFLSITDNKQMTDINKNIKELTIEMKEINQRYSNTIANISDLIEIQTEKINTTILNDKPQSLREFDKQSKQIIKSLVYESMDFVLEVISRNSLYENKINISKEIMMKFRHNIQQGSNFVDALPFRDEKVKQNLFLKIEKCMLHSYDEIIKILNVGESYNRGDLERSVRSIREEFVNKVNSIRYIDL